MNDSKESFQISQGYEIINPSPGKAYPILCKEWDYLKEKIGQIKDGINIYHTVGTLLIGASLTTIIGIFTGRFSSTQSQEIPTSLIVAWAIFAVTIICGTISICFAHEKRKVNEIKASDIIKQMAIIEQRYQSQDDIKKSKESYSLEIIKAFYGAKNKYLEVTDILKSMIVHNRLAIIPSNKLFGSDPFQDQLKELEVSYKYGDLTPVYVPHASREFSVSPIVYC
jgi:hypothetical protein